MKTLIKLSVSLVLFIFLLPTNIKAQCHIDDWTALKALYESTDGDNWSDNTGWEEVGGISPTTNCYLETLYGISLNINGRIKCIDLDGDDNCLPDNNLNGNNINGNIPTELSNLSDLIELDLSFNDLSGSIPAELGNLNNLKILNLSFNQLNGSIPQEFGNLPNLVQLNLSNNQLNGSIPVEIGNLISLIRLDLSHNSLNGNIPVQLFNLIHLSSIYLGSNNISGNIPSEIENLNGLEIFSISNNSLSGVIPVELGNIEVLSFLNLGNNQLIGSIPTSLGNLISLTNLTIGYNNLSGCYDDNLKNLCTQLNSNYFYGNLNISDGNNFDDTWQNFCFINSGNCINNSLSSNVYPGDLNHDGIVNNQDLGLWGLFLYETGPHRATEHQITNWNPYPAEDWNRLQINNEDIKHFDTTGNGAIEDDDCLAVTTNFGQTWSAPAPIPPNTTQSDYQVMLQAIDLLNEDYLILNIALERRAGGELDIRGGHFTIDYSYIEENINYVNLVLFDESWLGNVAEDLFYVITEFPDEKKIEIGFTKNNQNTTGNGIIGDLIISFANNVNRSATNSIMREVRVTGIGVQNGTEFTPIEDEICRINMDANNCQTNWPITENTPFQNMYEGNNLIETNGFLIIGDKQQVEYRSNRVCLQSGFKVKAGASFRAGYGNCN